MGVHGKEYEMDITFTIPDASKDRLINAICGTWAKDSDPSGALAKEIIRGYLLRVIKEYEDNEARKLATESVVVPDNLIQ